MFNCLLFNMIFTEDGLSSMNTPFTQTVQSSGPQLKSEEMDQVISAILSGKYSWACALVLRFTGHEPLNYLPQRTYTRIMRENWYAPNPSRKDCPSAPTNPYPHWPASQSNKLLRDLDYDDRVESEAEQVQGGGFNPWFYRFGDAAPDCRSWVTDYRPMF
jgi:hypothetical protein